VGFVYVGNKQQTLNPTLPLYPSRCIPQRFGANRPEDFQSQGYAFFSFISSFFVVLPFDESSPRPSDNPRFRKVVFYSNVSHPPASVSLDFNMDSDIMDDSVFDSYGNESDVYTPEVVCFFLDGAIIPTTNSLSCL
jgi:hypothetical protein